MLELGDSAETAASRFLGPFEPGVSADWAKQPAGSSGSLAGVEVWRKPGAEFYEGYVPPFRTRGVVRNVSPAVLMTQVLSTDKKGMGKIREDNKPVAKSLEKVDWQTEVQLMRNLAVIFGEFPLILAHLPSVSHGNHRCGMSSRPTPGRCPTASTSMSSAGASPRTAR